MLHKKLLTFLTVEQHLFGIQWQLLIMVLMHVNGMLMAIIVVLQIKMEIF